MQVAVNLRLTAQTEGVALEHKSKHW